MFDFLIGKLAPHRCLGCCKEGILLCAGCQCAIVSDENACYRCKLPVVDSAICRGCKSSSPFEAMFIAAEYNGYVEKLIRAYKFERAIAANQPLTDMMYAALPAMDLSPEAATIVFIPTASSRKRLRGYDQVGLLADELARKLGVPACDALSRRHGLRQLGANREQRYRQALGAFYIKEPAMVRGKTVILIDDVVTTGATVDAAARLLKKAGARRVVGLIGAYRRHD